MSLVPNESTAPRVRPSLFRFAAVGVRSKTIPIAGLSGWRRNEEASDGAPIHGCRRGDGRAAAERVFNLRSCAVRAAEPEARRRSARVV